MNFEKKYFTRSAFIFAAFMFAGCSIGSTAVSADDGAEQAKVEPAELAAPAKPEAEKPEAVTPVADVPAKTASAEDSNAVDTPDEISEELKKLGEATNKLMLERTLIESRLALDAAELDRELEAVQIERMKLEAERAAANAKVSEELVGIEEERTELERRLALESARANAAFRDKQRKLEMLQLETREMQAAMSADNMQTRFPIAVADKKEQLSKLAPAAAQAPKYLKEPFVDGTLYISDRRIALNGAITDALAKTVCDQLYFYNNQNSEYPIFIVIDNSPGGSVSAGYQIQKAMQACSAPVYVVVKGMAASMAAVITTTAERSFCFANTLILHHQISTGFRGNLTVLREGVAQGEKWYRLFCGPVAEKMGISLEELTKQMYAHNSDGDWQETGERAVALKWVDHIAERIDETGVISIGAPKMNGMTPMNPVALPESVDAHGKRFVELPVLENPFDFWALYDKDNYYRTR